MPMRSTALSVRTTMPDEARGAPDLPWPPPPANDPVVLSPEPFDGRLRGPRPEPRAPRAGGVIAVLAVGLIIVAAVAVLMVGRFGVPASRAATAPDRGTEVAQAAPVAGQNDAGTASELTEGLNALRARMQAARSTGSVAETRAALTPATDLSPNLVPAAPPPPTPAAVTEPDVPRSGPGAAEVAAMLERARGLIAVGDIAAARRLAEYAASGGDGAALFALAETFDPAQLARWRVRGVRAEPEKARALYRRALERGVAGAKARLAALP